MNETVTTNNHVYINKNLEEYRIEQRKKLEEKHKKDEDYRYIPSLTWLEMYLPHYEDVFGNFKYSKDNLTNKQKCEELLNYFSEVCGVSKIEDIYKRKPRKGMFR